MTDLSSLIAKLGDCPKTEHLLKLFEYKRGMAEAHFPCPPLSETPWMDALLELAEKLDGALALNAECWRKRESADARVAELKRQMDQCVWMLHKAAQEYMTGSRAVISWTDYIRDLESRWEKRGGEDDG